MPVSNGRGPSAPISRGGPPGARRRVAPLLAGALLAGCVSYRPAPLDPAEVLRDLEHLSWTAAVADSGSGYTPRQLAALAVTHQPELRVLRAELGVARARLVEAGRLPDPELGWDAMDAVAAAIAGGDPGSQEVVSGLGVMFPLLRPGEGDALTGAAEWRRVAALRRVLTAEWELTRDVHLACEAVVAAERRRDQTAELTELAGSTDAYFRRARNAGAATAIQANLAAGQLQALRLDAVAADAALERARQSLNALLGLPPSLELRIAVDEQASSAPELERTTAQLLAHAVEVRPDLAELLARYQAAEQEVRLAVARQFPLVAVGTGIRVTPGWFSGFGRPAIGTALARREQLRVELRALVHRVRREIAAARARWETARRELEVLETGLLPNAESTLELSRAAFAAGEMTLLESLALQRSLVEARTRHTEARAELAESACVLRSAAGLLLAPANPNPPPAGRSAGATATARHEPGTSPR